ncbi:MAG: AT hook motif [Ignavibacteria bacterium GWF2_33_9]|nr:MAG: AT hook motif [Ignavibacteria bacterium GWF2_33_9]
MSTKKNKAILVKKNSGDEEFFEVSKLEASLKRAGAESNISKKIVNDIANWIYPGISTKRIYSHAFSLLRKQKVAAALKYKIKNAIMELGPSGYPFENFIGEIFAKQEYEVEVGKVIEGYCITHEMDVIATKNNIQHLVECKFSRDQDKHINIQVPLYVRSRIDDIVKKRKNSADFDGFTFQGWVVTNKRFSQESIDYGNCSGLNLLGWDYPKGNGLTDIIERLKIYPITILSRITKQEKHILLEKSIVTCSKILQNPQILDLLDIDDKKRKAVIKEIQSICS